MYTLIIECEKKEYPEGVTWEDIAKEYQKNYPSPIAAVSLDGKIRELFKKVSRSGEVKFFCSKRCPIEECGNALLQSERHGCSQG